MGRITGLAGKSKQGKRRISGMLQVVVGDLLDATMASKSVKDLFANCANRWANDSRARDKSSLNEHVVRTGMFRCTELA